MVVKTFQKQEGSICIIIVGLILKIHFLFVVDNFLRVKSKCWFSLWAWLRCSISILSFTIFLITWLSYLFEKKIVLRFLIVLMFL